MQHLALLELLVVSSCLVVATLSFKSSMLSLFSKFSRPANKFFSLARLLRMSSSESHSIRMSSSESHSRFWSRQIELRIPPVSKDMGKEQYLDGVKTALEQHAEAKSVTQGVAMLPDAYEGDSSDNMLLVPLMDGLVQTQHITRAPVSALLSRTMSMSMSKDMDMDASGNNEEKGKSNALLLAFNPRARSVEISPDEQERPLDEERVSAINKELLEVYSIDAIQLMSNSDYSGTCLC